MMGMDEREDGWYRVTFSGNSQEWEQVSDADAEAEIAAGGGWDLVCVKSVTALMDPLF